MKKAVIGILFLSVTALPCIAGTVPSVTAEVRVVGETKEYLYTLTNDLDSGEYIYVFSVYMPEAAARSVIGFTSSKPNWYFTHSFRAEYSLWAITALTGAVLLEGETVVFALTAPSAVPTGYDYQPPTYPSNWKWSAASEVEFGSPNLPVPVPEPSSLLALGAGVCALGLPRLRRRRRVSGP